MLHICVKLEHLYIRNVNVRWTDRWTDRHDHRLTDHVGLAQARPNYPTCMHKGLVCPSVVVAVSTKITRSQDLGVIASEKSVIKMSDMSKNRVICTSKRLIRTTSATDRFF